MVGASVLPLVAMVAMLALVRNTSATRAGHRQGSVTVSA